MRRESTAHVDDLVARLPGLSDQGPAVCQVAQVLIDSARGGGTLFTCGNGGSAADADHMVGELMKRFRHPRPLSANHRERLAAARAPQGRADGLEGGLRAVRLGAHDALTSAVLNDSDASLVFAQPLYVLGREGDAVLGISTSGNSVNVLNALRVGKAFGMRTLGLTGEARCEMDDVCEVVVHVCARETHLIQELHQPTMRALCLALEEEFFGPVYSPEEKPT